MLQNIRISIEHMTNALNNIIAETVGLCINCNESSLIVRLILLSNEQSAVQLFLSCHENAVYVREYVCAFCIRYFCVCM